MKKTLWIGFFLILVISLNACSDSSLFSGQGKGKGNGGGNSGQSGGDGGGGLGGGVPGSGNPGSGVPGAGPESSDNQPGNGAPQPGVQGGPGSGQMGGMGGMRARHMAQIPKTYQGQKNIVTPDQASISRGEEMYIVNCATCHGDGGMGDGPSMPALDPAPAPLAHTSMMLSDDYLYWRISEGGSQPPFSSAMPAWKEVLDKQDRWDVINYLRALGSGQVKPRSRLGGATYDPKYEAQQRGEMLAQAQELGLVTKEEANTFELVHQALDNLVAAQTPRQAGRMDEIQDQLLQDLVQAGKLTQDQVMLFVEIHERLIEAGLME